MIQAVERALNILEMLSGREGGEKTLREIADELGLNHATCANLIKTLMERGYITKVYTRRTYTLGPMAYQLGSGGNCRTRLVEAARPVMEALAARLNESVVLTIFEQDRCFLVHEVKSRQLLQVNHDSLYIRDVSRKATGRLLLAHLDRPQRERFLSRNALGPADWEGAATLGELHALLDAIENEPVHRNADRHVTGFAAPVMKDQRTVAALGVYVPDVRLAECRAVEEQLAQAARDIAARLPDP